MTVMSRRRRSLLAVTALAASVVLFRANLASALVTRGDDVLPQPAIIRLDGQLAAKPSINQYTKLYFLRTAESL